MPRYDDDEDFENEDLDTDEIDDDDRGEQQERFVKLSRKDIRRLERKAKQVEKAEQRVKELERERAFEKAKVDVAKPLGAHFAETYHGEVDPEKIREKAEELGIPLLAEATKPEGPDLKPGEEDSTKERQDVSSGGKPDEGEEPPPADPKVEALKAGQAVIDEGKKEEEGLAAGIGALAAAAQSGDTRATWSPGH